MLVTMLNVHSEVLVEMSASEIFLWMRQRKFSPKVNPI